MPAMNLSETRIREVPSVEDLEKIERWLDPQPSGFEVDTLEAFTREEILERLAEDDERLEDTEYTLNGNSFSYEGLKGSISVEGDSIYLSVFEPGEKDLEIRDVMRIGGASRGETMHKRAVSNYRNSLRKAGYEADELEEEALAEKAGEALDELGYRSFEVEINDCTREAYEEAVEKIRDHV